MTFLVVRVRSDINVRHDIKKTMHSLNLTKVNHAVLVPNRPEIIGMLKKAKDYITWGEPSKDTIESLIRERGKMVGDIPITDDLVKEYSNFKGIKALADALVSGEAEIKSVENMKRVFRLHPPRGTKGWGGIKRTFVTGGALGNRGTEINSLVERML
ncbi:MAG: 50S ribosomal protein L30 [Methanobacteriota archaeon]|mgnify:CR=1 FL=1|nr:MAG: 50S ribosomal protein L30 [Euryarchaeota archaeon]|tara:strand:+ start:10669 stop:11139 length:471 start_codon:yes stop_codon:yes gene_type:complete